jgi:hypothetical protein
MLSDPDFRRAFANELHIGADEDYRQKKYILSF